MITLKKFYGLSTMSRLHTDWCKRAVKQYWSAWLLRISAHQRANYYKFSRWNCADLLRKHPVEFVLYLTAASYLITKILKQHKGLEQQSRCLLCPSCLQWQHMTDSPGLWGVWGLKHSLSNQKYWLLHALQSLLQEYFPTVPISIIGK